MDFFVTLPTPKQAAHEILPFPSDCFNHGNHGHNWPGRANLSIHTSFNMFGIIFMHGFCRKSHSHYNFNTQNKECDLIWCEKRYFCCYAIFSSPFSSSSPLFLLSCSPFNSSKKANLSHFVIFYGGLQLFFIFLLQPTYCCLKNQN